LDRLAGRDAYRRGLQSFISSVPSALSIDVCQRGGDVCLGPVPGRHLPGARRARQMPGLSGFQWANVVFIGLSSAVGYFCLLWALSRLEASRVMSFQALAPITAVLIELSSGSYPLTWRLTGAFVLVLSGVWFGTHERRAPV